MSAYLPLKTNIRARFYPQEYLNMWLFQYILYLLYMYSVFQMQCGRISGYTYYGDEMTGICNLIHIHEEFIF